MELRPDLYGHESHRVLWAAAALVCSLIICFTLILSLACPWYYMDYTDAKVIGKPYYNFRWEGVRESKGEEKGFYKWDDKELDGFSELQSIFQATLVFVLFAFFHGLFILIPLIILVIPLPGDAQLNFGSLQWGLSGIRMVASVVSMVFCACMLLWLALAWFVFFGVTDAFEESPWCDKKGTMPFSDGPCAHFSGVDDDNPYGPSAGWVFAFFTFFYLTYLCVCLVMTVLSEGASIPSKLGEFTSRTNNTSYNALS